MLFNSFCAGETLPFGNGVLAAEIILVFLMAGIEMLRLFFGKYLV